MSDSTKNYIKEIGVLSYNPSLAQDRFFQELDSRLKGDLTLGDVSNPYSLIAEQSIINLVSATSTFETVCNQVLGLSNNEEDLFRFLNGIEDVGLFSYPATGYFDFYIELNSIKNNGGYIEELESYIVTIPKKSKITVDNLDYTILNNLNIMLRVNNNGWVPFIEVVNNEELISFKHIGNVNSVVITDNNNIEWVKFTLPVKQLKLVEYIDDIILSEKFDKVIELKNEYYLSSSVYISDSINNDFRKLEKNLSDEFSLEKDKIIVQYLNNRVRFKTPILNTVMDNMSGTLKIELFTTKGKIFQPLNTYTAEAFEFNIASSDDNIYGDSNNLNVFINSQTVVDGGYISKGVEDFKKIIKHRITNHNDLPITEKQLKKMVYNDGFALEKILDSLTKRTFVVFKEPDISLSTDINVLNRVMSNTTKLYLPSIDNKNIFISDDEKFIIIKSNTIFKSDNGLVEPISESLRTSLLHYNQDILESVTNKQRLLFTPYYYIISIDNDVFNSRVYDLDRPTVSDLNILRKNYNIKKVNGNIEKYEVLKTINGFKFSFTVSGNDEFENMKNDLKLEVSIKIKGTPERIYYYAEINEDGKFEIEIKTNHFINDTDTLQILNGDKKLTTTFVNLEDKLSLKLFTTRLTIGDDLNSGDIYNSPYGNYIFLTDHEINYKFGSKLEYLWNKLSISYGDNKYKRYTNDAPLVYQKDIYDFTSITDVEVTDEHAIPIKLHSRGDLVKDDNGDTIYQHKAGDLILEDGKPVIDQIGGVIRYLDILMIDYKFKISKDLLINENTKNILVTLDYWLKYKLVEYNQNMLDNTVMFYKPLLNYKTCKIKIGQNEKVVNNKIKPTVEIFTVDVNSINTEEIYHSIGKIIDFKLTRSYVDVLEMIDEIMGLFNNTVKSIKISNIGDNFVTFKYLDRNRMYIPKKIKNSIITYDYEMIVTDISQ